MTMGVYAIRNVVTGDRYVGSSLNIEHRAEEHVWKLERWAKADKINRFVADWVKYGKNAFEVDILEEHTDEPTMRAREQWFIAHEPCAYNGRVPKPGPTLRINYPNKEAVS